MRYVSDADFRVLYIVSRRSHPFFGVFLPFYLWGRGGVILFGGCGREQVARLLESKGVGNVTPQELMRELASFGLVGEEAEDVLIQVNGVH